MLFSLAVLPSFLATTILVHAKPAERPSGPSAPELEFSSAPYTNPNSTSNDVDGIQLKYPPGYDSSTCSDSADKTPDCIVVGSVTETHSEPGNPHLVAAPIVFGLGNESTCFSSLSSVPQNDSDIICEIYTHGAAQDDFELRATAGGSAILGCSAPVPGAQSHADIGYDFLWRCNLVNPALGDKFAMALFRLPRGASPDGAVKVTGEQTLSNGNHVKIAGAGRSPSAVS